MAGKGDKPRSCFSKKFRQNYDEIDWGEGASERSCKRNSRRFFSDESGDRGQQKDHRRNNCKRSCKCKEKS